MVPLSRAAIETVGERSSRSGRVRGRARSVVMRPAPVWVSMPVMLAGVDPARRNCLPVVSWSMRRRTVSQSSGSRCHSSSRTGRVSMLMRLGAALRIWWWLRRSRRRIADACWSDVAVLPTPFGSVDQDGGQGVEEFVDFVVDDSADVAGLEVSWRRHRLNIAQRTTSTLGLVQPLRSVSSTPCGVATVQPETRCALPGR